MTQEATHSSFEFVSTRLVLQVLQALGKSSKQVVSVKIAAHGIEFSYEDEGKVCQSTVFFPATYFSAFNFSGQNSTFSVQLVSLIDALRVFTSMPDVAVLVSETPDHLELEVSDTEGAGAAMHMYAHIMILDATTVVNLSDHWKAPATEFTAEAATMREALDDLEWPHGHVRVTVQSHPVKVVFFGKGNIGELEISLSHDRLRNTRTHGSNISFNYAYKFLKAALSGVPGIKSDYSSQISIDANGLLKVVHVLPTVGRTAWEAEASAQSAEVSHDIVLTHMVQPMFLDDMQEAMEMEVQD